MKAAQPGSRRPVTARAAVVKLTMGYLAFCALAVTVLAVGIAANDRLAVGGDVVLTWATTWRFITDLGRIRAHYE